MIGANCHALRCAGKMPPEVARIVGASAGMDRRYFGPHQAVGSDAPELDFPSLDPRPGTVDHQVELVARPMVHDDEVSEAQPYGGVDLVGHTSAGVLLEEPP